MSQEMLKILPLPAKAKGRSDLLSDALERVLNGQLEVTLTIRLRDQPAEMGRAPLEPAPPPPAPASLLAPAPAALPLRLSPRHKKILRVLVGQPPRKGDWIAIKTGLRKAHGGFRADLALMTHQYKLLVNHEGYLLTQKGERYAAALGEVANHNHPDKEGTPCSPATSPT